MAEADPSRSIDEYVRGLVSAGDLKRAATHILRELGPEVFGFLVAAHGSSSDADEVFAAVSERIWRSIGGFRWQCSLKTWVYVIARNETSRYLRGAHYRNQGRVGSSELNEVVAAVRTETQSALQSDKLNKLRALRDELPIEDRTILILRVDRALQWDEMARVFLESADDTTQGDIKREAARLRKRYQLVKQRLGERVRQERLIS